jgi:hypothetical protein
LYNLSRIDKELIKSTEQNLDKYFVAAACFINEEGIAQHVGLIIHSEEGYFLFHYTGEKVLFEDRKIEEWYFHKSIEFILPEFCGIFLGYCMKIAQNAKPEYGFFYDGSFYDINGNYYSKNQIPEFMTCVGFCINVIKGFIEADEYFEYKDWTNQKASQQYINEMIAQIRKIAPHVTEEMISDNIRRIKPSEFVGSAFLKNIPIRKSDIDLIIDDLEKVIYRKKMVA